VKPVYLLSSERRQDPAAAQRAAAKGFRILTIPGAGPDGSATRRAKLCDALLAFPS
jgi:hypothetical protein